VNANLYEEDDSNNVLLLSNLPLEYDLEETMEKMKKREVHRNERMFPKMTLHSYKNSNFFLEYNLT
jgi:hypothetical protein